jgi:hypothetical protein
MPKSGSPQFPKARAQWSVKRTVLIALGMGLLGVIAGYFTYLRSGPQPKGKPGPETSPSTSVKPATELVGLGYLPADTNIAFAIQAGPVVAYSEKLQKDPNALLIQAGIPAKVFDSIASFGLTLQQIDHIAGGTSLGDGAAELRLCVVLVLRSPLAKEGDSLHKLKARELGGKNRYSIDLNGFPMYLARMSPTIWVFGLDNNKDFEAVDRGGYGPGGKHFPQGLSQAIADRVPQNAALWIATDEHRWAEKNGVKLLIEFMKKKEWLPVLARGRSALMAVSLDEPPRIRLFIKAADAKTGEQLRSYFQKLAASDDLARQGGSGDLAFYDAPIDPMNAFAIISRFLSDAEPRP